MGLDYNREVVEVAFSAIVVGNGPSIWGSHRGSFIDSHDWVIRLGAFRKAYNIWDYGRKTNSIMIPNTLCWRMIGHSFIPNVEFWIGYKFGPKYGTVGVSGSSTDKECGCNIPENPSKIIRLNTYGNKLVYFSVLFTHYKALFSDKFENEYFFSKGTMAALIAMDYLMPNRLVMIGCDNLKTGIQEPYMSFRFNFGTNKTETGEVTSQHLWWFEHKLIEKASQNYPVEVVYV